VEFTSTLDWDTGLGSTANTVVPAKAGIQGAAQNVLFWTPAYYYFVRTGNKLNNDVILRSAATKDLRFFASTSFRLRMTFQSFCWAHVPGNKVVLGDWVQLRILLKVTR